MARTTRLPVSSTAVPSSRRVDLSAQSVKPVSQVTMWQQVEAAHPAQHHPSQRHRRVGRSTARRSQREAVPRRPRVGLAAHRRHQNHPRLAVATTTHRCLRLARRWQLQLQHVLARQPRAPVPSTARWVQTYPALIPRKPVQSPGSGSR